MPWWVIYIPAAVGAFSVLSSVTKNDYDNKFAAFLVKLVNVGAARKPDGAQIVQSPPASDREVVEKELKSVIDKQVSFLHGLISKVQSEAKGFVSEKVGALIPDGEDEQEVEVEPSDPGDLRW